MGLHKEGKVLYHITVSWRAPLPLFRLTGSCLSLSSLETFNSVCLLVEVGLDLMYINRIQERIAMCAAGIKDAPRTRLQPLKKGQNKILLILSPNFLFLNVCDLAFLEPTAQKKRTQGVSVILQLYHK